MIINSDESSESRMNELEQEKIIVSKILDLFGQRTEELERIKDEIRSKLNKLITKVETSERKYRQLYDDAPDMYRTINTDGIILDCNKAYSSCLGYKKEEIIGRSIFEHTADESMSQMRNSFETWKKDGHVESREVRMKRKDGTIFSVLVSATNLYDDKGNLVGSNTVIKDITEICKIRKKLEESEKQIREQLEQLKKVGAEKDEFLAMITHELKTPLVPIKGYTDMLLSDKLGPLTELQRQRISVISSSCLSLLRLIGDLLDAQKLELGRLKFEMNLHNLTDIISDVVNQIKPDAHRFGVEIITNFQDDVLCNCDKERIEQVLINIISNSLDFSPKGTGKIKMTLNKEENYAKIVIKDNGIGLSPEKLKKIFVKFYQVDTTTKREHGGSGLGLSVCKGIIENHGGKIWAESEGFNKGVEMHILLPLYSKSKIERQVSSSQKR
ncbi:PAS domain-containing sensor histidine kinase [Candidatus Pacearchaeota archaeon]|nr:PAS domain-containing sensor histidine kinase [Candidatus Pacearchaeota archaeon]